MPIFDMLRKLACCAPRQQEEDLEMAPLMQPDPEPVAAWPEEPGRPYRDFVEDEARKYWEEMVNPGSLAKPDQEEIRAAAMPILCAAQRRRTGRSSLAMAHQGVNAMQLRAVEKGWIKHPFTPSEASSDYIEALVQLADDANWLAREITLPNHPAPKHPPIYCTRNPITGRPVPRRDAKIRGDYVYTSDGRRLTRDDYIYPWPGPDHWPMVDDLNTRHVTACYSLNFLFREKGYIMLHWKVGPDSTYKFRNTLDSFHFSPYPPARHMTW